VVQVDFRGLNGVNLATDTFGNPEDPAVLLLPATAQTKEMWHGIGEALGAAGRYAVCMDARGHGGSGAPLDGDYSLDALAADIRAVVSCLPSRPAIVGVGASGLAAILAVGESPTAIASALILVGVTPWADPAVIERVQRAFAKRSETFSDAASALEALAATHPFEPAPSEVARLMAAFQVDEHGTYRWRCDPRVLSVGHLPKESQRLEAAAAQVTMPTLLLRGTLNENVSAETTQRLQTLIVGAESVEIAGTGHHVVTDREDLFNAALLDFLERRAPRAPIQFRGGSDPRVLRDALGCFATGVTVVTTTNRDGDPIGLTANSFTSVSLDPPLILFCLAKSSGSLEAFETARGFAVNVLHIGQQPASARFARRDGPRFEGMLWEAGEAGAAPLLSGSLASFDCVRRAVYDGGDHLIFLGEVRSARFEPHRDPLLFFRGKYRRLHFA
jgi:flavin reductase (DIM6/NTAB) family NADH-FMN oxidoreductase RutF/pimeloyl-ACP methyl ester carboxylesterase